MLTACSNEGNLSRGGQIVFVGPCMIDKAVSKKLNWLQYEISWAAKNRNNHIVAPLVSEGDQTTVVYQLVFLISRSLWYPWIFKRY